MVTKKKKEQRNLINNKRSNKRKLTLAEMNRERLLLRQETIQKYEEGYVSDFVYKIGIKHGWFEEEE
jgi:hypothetical protein